jgi:hypothetical protein
MLASCKERGGGEGNVGECGVSQAHTGIIEAMPISYAPAKKLQPVDPGERAEDDEDRPSVLWRGVLTRYEVFDEVWGHDLGDSRTLSVVVGWRRRPRDEGKRRQTRARGFDASGPDS